MNIWPFTKSAPEQKLIGNGLMDMFWGVSRSKSGIDVSPAAAMRQPTVYACVRIISETVAQLPLHVYDRSADGVKERDTSSALHRIFANRVNDWTTPFDFKRDMSASVLLYGHAFAGIARDNDGNPRFLTQIPTRAVRIVEDKLTGEPRYTVNLEQGGERTYLSRDMLHLSAYEGQAPIALAKEAIALALAQEEQLVKIVNNGVTPSGALVFENGLSAEGLERAQSQFRQMADNAGTAIFDRGAKYIPIARSLVDSQFLEMRRHQVAEIARVFRVPLHMLQELERITHQNAEQLGRQFLQFTMAPWLTMWEQECRLKLGGDADNRFFEFLTDDIAKADLAARMEAYSKAVGNGIINPNEARAMENRAPYKGGDQFLRPLNMEAADNG